MPEISIKAETIFHLFGFPITNSFFLSVIVTTLIGYMAVTFFKESNKDRRNNFYYLIKFIVKSIYSLFESVLGEKTKYFFPLLLSFFLFIIINNWVGLLPGIGSILIAVEEHHKILHVPLFRGANADLNTTFVLAIVSVIMIQIYGIRFLGFGGYIKKFVNLTNPINFFLGILEILSEFSKIISFSFRLFGNIFAGEVLLTIVAFLVPVLASFPFIMLELFVGFIQALVFSMLTAVFISGAVTAHH